MVATPSTVMTMALTLHTRFGSGLGCQKQEPRGREHGCNKTSTPKAVCLPRQWVSAFATTIHRRAVSRTKRSIVGSIIFKCHKAEPADSPEITSRSALHRRCAEDVSPEGLRPAWMGSNPIVQHRSRDAAEAGW